MRRRFGVSFCCSATCAAVLGLSPVGSAKASCSGGGHRSKRERRDEAVMKASSHLSAQESDEKEVVLPQLLLGLLVWRGSQVLEDSILSSRRKRHSSFVGKANNVCTLKHALSGG